MSVERRVDNSLLGQAGRRVVVERRKLLLSRFFLSCFASAKRLETAEESDDGAVEARFSGRGVHDFLVV